jgi:hypothetical protein
MRQLDMITPTSLDEALKRVAELEEESRLLGERQNTLKEAITALANPPPPPPIDKIVAKWTMRNLLTSSKQYILDKSENDEISVGEAFDCVVADHMKMLQIEGDDREAQTQVQSILTAVPTAETDGVLDEDRAAALGKRRDCVISKRPILRAALLRAIIAGTENIEVATERGISYLQAKNAVRRAYCEMIGVRNLGSHLMKGLHESLVGTDLEGIPFDQVWENVRRGSSQDNHTATRHFGKRRHVALRRDVDYVD